MAGVACGWNAGHLSSLCHLTQEIFLIPYASVLFSVDSMTITHLVRSERKVNNTFKDLVQAQVL